MAITDLTNTKWLFNETLNDTSITSNIDFLSDGVLYNSLNRELAEPPFFGNSMNYGDTIVYGFDFGGWINQSYRTIEISGGTDATNTTLITWLQSNATQLSTLTPKEQYQEQMTNLANAINEKTGGTSPLSVSDMVSAVRGIPTVIEVATEANLPTTATDGTIAIVTGGGN